MWSPRASGNSSNCSRNSNCDECVGTLADTTSCSWCTSSSTCVPSDTTTCHDLQDTCDTSYYLTIFVIIIASLIFLCCIACLLRRINRSRGRDDENSFYSPLLGRMDRSTSSSRHQQDEEVEWMCTICGFDNKIRNKFCHLCGTSHEFTTDYTVEKQKQKKKNQNGNKKKEILIPKDAQLFETVRFSFGSQTSGGVGLTGTGTGGGLTESERREALNYRRLNQLTLRQKGARRRKMWQRVVDEETGELVWVRVNFKEAMKQTKGDHSLHSSSLPPPPPSPLSRPVSSSGHSHSHSLFRLFGGGGGPTSSPQRALSFQSASTTGRLDSFDAVLNSHSPGYASYLDPSGQIQWEKLESGSMNVNPSLSLLHPSHAASAVAAGAGHLPPSSSSSLLRHHHHHPPNTVTAYEHLLPDLIPHDKQSILALSFQDKLTWFSDTLTILQRPWSEGFVRLDISRPRLFQDSFQQLMALSLEDGGVHRWMRIQFLHEPGIDAGGIEREWFLLLTQRIFEHKTGLFTHSGGSSYHINPLSHLIYPGEGDGEGKGERGRGGATHLQYYHFVGRLLAKAIMEQQQIPALLSIPLRKHLLGMPITFSDLEFVDLELYRNLCWLRDYEEEGERESGGVGGEEEEGTDGIEALGLVFSVDYSFGERDETITSTATAAPLTRGGGGGGGREQGGESETKDGHLKRPSSPSTLPPDEEVIGIEPGRVYHETYQLIPHGADTLVTSATKDEYLELRLRHRMLDSMKQPLESFLKGFYEVLPVDLISVFDYQELELLMCGLPTIDLDDWKRYTEYLGEYYRLGPRHKTIRWFWEVVGAYSGEERIRLLQFTTGCSRLPAKGFRALQSNDGNLRRFNIQSIRKTVSSPPHPLSSSLCS
jgi:hypothetical protein